MLRALLRAYLLPHADESNPGFRAGIQSSGAAGLRILGAIQVLATLLIMGARLFIERPLAPLPLRWKTAGLILALGALNLVVARMGWAASWTRAIALLSASLMSAVLFWASFLDAAQSANGNDFILGEITLVLLVIVTIMPLRPLHTLILGVAILVEYIITAKVAERTLHLGAGPAPNYIIFIVMITLLSVGISAVLYRQRWSNHEILQQTIEAAEALRQAQNRILLTENAASLSHLTAAISHEMNNPLGAMLSGIDTLLLLAERHAAATPAEGPKLIELQAEVRRSIQQSAERIKELVGKLQRFTDLDETAMTPADLNEIVRSVAAMVDSEKDKKPMVDLRLAELPRVMCRPRQLAAVFRNLLGNALNAVNGDGRIAIATRASGENVEIEIEDNGRGITAEQITNIFEPEFRVQGGRVAAGNWGMFNSRQIVREHGGDIRIRSREGQGTRVTIILPTTR